MKWLLTSIAHVIERWFRWIRRNVFGEKSPLPTVPHGIPIDPAHVPTGPNLIRNGSFENGDFGAGSSKVFQGSGVIQYWNAFVNGGNCRWLDNNFPVIGYPADGIRHVDLTGGAPPGPGRKLAIMLQDGVPVTAGKSYEIGLEVGVGTSAAASGHNYGPPVSVDVSVLRPPAQLTQTFVCNPPNPPGPGFSGVVWTRFAFRFAIPAGYALSQVELVQISGAAGEYFIGVDNVTLHELT